MKHITKRNILALLLTASTIGPVWADQMPDSSGANSYVKTISINADQPYPVIVVKSDGETYTETKDSGQKKTFRARVTGVCKDTKYLNFASYNLSKNKYSNGTVAHKELDVSGPKHKTFGHNIAVDIQWSPDSSVENKAVNACRDYMQQQKAGGKSLVQILGKEQRIVVDSGMYGAFNLNCAGLISAGVKHRFAMQPMEVVCEPSAVKMNLDLSKANLFKINQVNFQPLQPSYTGSCPSDFNFVGYIKTNGEQGEFRYRYLDHFGNTSNWQIVQRNKGQNHYAINHTIKLQDIKLNDKPGLPNQVQNQQGNGLAPIPQMGVLQNPWVTLEVENLANQKKYQHKASYKYTCTQPPTLKVASFANNLQKADLTVLANTFQLGSKTATNGKSLTIGAEEANSKVADLCQFRMQYKIKNEGLGDADTLFTTQVKKGNTTLHLGNTPSLGKGQTHNLSGNLKLATGNNLLVIKTDHASKVDESNEGNNLLRIMVTVKGDCNSNTPPRPGSNNGTPPRPADPSGTPRRPLR